MDAALARLVPVVAPALAAYSAGVGVLDGAYAALADFVGAPADYVKLFSLLILALPLAAPLPHLPPRAKHLANIAVSGIFMGPVLHIYGGYLQLLASAALTYVLVALGVGGRRMPWIVMFFQMGHLLVKSVLLRVLWPVLTRTRAATSCVSSATSPSLPWRSRRCRWSWS